MNSIIIIIFIIIIYVLINIIKKREKYKKRDKVIILGLSRTGTSSICDLLSKLDYHSWHFTPNHHLLEELFGFNAFGDLPEFRRNFTKHDIKPDTKYILTTRNKDLWLKSITKWFKEIWNIDIKHKNKAQPIINCNFKLSSLFKCSMFNNVNNKIHNVLKEYPEMYDANFKDVIQLHESNIIDQFKKAGKLNQLLVIDITDKSVSDSIKLNKIIKFLDKDPERYKSVTLDNISYDKLYLKQIIKLCFK